MKNLFVFRLANFLLFQAGWWLAVVTDYSWRAVAVMLLAVANSLLPDWQYSRLIGVFSIAMVGMINDYVLMLTGVLIFPEDPLFLPLWFCSIWLVFVSTFHLSLSFLYNIPVYQQALLSAVGASMSYGFGAQIAGISSVVSQPYFTLVIAVDFALLVPVLLFIYSRLLKSINHGM